MTIKEVINQATQILQKMYLADGALTGIPQKKRREFDARLDAEVLLAHTLSTTREELLTHAERNVSINDYKKFQNYVERRLKHEPIALIIGKKEFYGLMFKVEKGVLIPRPETELLVEKALLEAKILHKNFGCDFVVADIGTGCGNIIISLVKNLQKSFGTSCFPKFFGVDTSEKILALARENAKAHRVEELIEFKIGNLIEPIPYHIDLLVANLPYLPKSDYLNAPLDVRLYEPEAALVGGDDGLDYYRELFDQIARHILDEHKKFSQRHQMTLLLEIDPCQPNSLKSAVKERFPKASLKFFFDFSGRLRVAKISLF